MIEFSRVTLRERFMTEAEKPFFPLRDNRRGRVLFDQFDGVGACSISQGIGYSAFVAFMQPDTFLKLAASGIVHDSTDYILNGLRQYEGTDKFPLASPFLIVNFRKKPAAVVCHEGRNRMRALRAFGADEIPVAIYPASGETLGDIDAPKLSRFFNEAVSQDGARVRGPLFYRAIVGNRMFSL